MTEQQLSIRHCTASLMQMFEQNPKMKTKEAFFEVITKIQAYKDYFEKLNKEQGEHAGTIYLLRLIDELLKQNLEEPSPWAEDEKIKDSISCRKGCAHCCRQKVSASEPEVKLILEYCKEEGVSIDAAYLEKQQDLTQETWGLSEHADCVFLDKDQACKIYPARPAACRKYVVTNKPELCNIKKYPKGAVSAFGVLEIEIAASVFPNLKKEPDDTSLANNLLKLLTDDQGTNTTTDKDHTASV